MNRLLIFDCLLYTDLQVQHHSNIVFINVSLLSSFGAVLHLCYAFYYCILWSWVIIVIPFARPCHMTLSWVVFTPSPMRTEYSVLIFRHCTCSTTSSIYQTTTAFFGRVIWTIVHIVMPPRAQNTPGESRLYTAIFALILAEYLIVHL